ncbi:Cytochrome P450 monooxygenase lepD [Lasiodiplodia hormozganensis]|uniref:Cytochrome P450 monooxygenase lepD n=1 Tax=Lasiodiplodia hormozganensis TaxID=869390 RepID=A0AA40BYU7_9PEZI|nr:Cytochrome P450 monooxygenase lepD [Lasiodiplodia hormozganensis]
MLSTSQVHVIGLIPKSAYGTCLALGLVLLAIYIYDQFNSVRYRLAKVLVQQMGYFKNAQGEKMKELRFNSRFVRFSQGHAMSEQGVALAGTEPYLTWNDGKPEVVLTRPEHVKDFFGRESKGHAKPPHMGMGPYFDRVLGSSVGVLNGDKWKAMRRVFEPHLSHQMAMAFSARFGREVAAWMAELPAEWAKAAGADGAPFVVDAATACRFLPFKLVALALYGDALSEKAYERLLELNALHEKVMLRAFFGKAERSELFSRLPSESKALMDQFEREWRDFNLEIIERAEKEKLSCPVAKMHPSVLDGSVAERQFLHTIDEILFANIDVTSSVLAFLLINLARNCAAQTQLRAEILANAADPDAYVQKTDTLLERTCMESIRLCPAAWFSLPEHATADTTVGGFAIPAGTPCIIDWWRLNTQSPVWTKPTCFPDGDTPDGTAFHPQRFAALAPQEYRWSFLRFGLGSRKCIGKNFGGVIMKAFLVPVLREWRLESVGLTKEEERGLVETRKDRFAVTPDRRVKFVPV